MWRVSNSAHEVQPHPAEGPSVLEDRLLYPQGKIPSDRRMGRIGIDSLSQGGKLPLGELL